MCIFMGAFGAGMASQFVGDINEAKNSARKILADL